MKDQQSQDPSGRREPASARGDSASTLWTRSFLAGLIGTVASRGIVVALGLLTSVLVARSLGPAGRGEFAVATALSSIGLQIASLGIHTASLWSVSRNPELLGRLVANGMVASGVAGGILALAFGLMFTLAPATAPLQGPILVLALVSIPIALANLVLLNLALGLNQVRLFNVLELGQRFLATCGIVMAIVAGAVTSSLAFACVVGASAGSLAGGLVALGRGSTTPMRVSLTLLRSLAAYGVRAYLAALFTFLVLRVDVLILERMLGDRQVGEYSVAVSLAEFAYLGPVTVAVLLFPRLAAMSDPRLRWATAARWALLTGAGAAFVMLVGWLVGGELIVLLYGSEFGGGTPALAWLLPGIVLLSVHTILMNYFYAIGTPWITVGAPLGGAALNVVLNLALIPRFGIVGSALASTVAYGVMLLISVGYFLLIARPRTVMGIR